MSDNNRTQVTVSTVVDAPIEKVWAYWTEPEHIPGWAFASDDWEATDPVNDLRPGGDFSTRMSAKDKSEGFDFAGTYTAVTPHKLIEYDLGDERHVTTLFTQRDDSVHIEQTFDAENNFPVDDQQAGWQAFLDNFKRYTENN